MTRLAAIALLALAAPASAQPPTPCPSWLAAKAPSARAAYDRLSPRVARDWARFVGSGRSARLGRTPDDPHALVAARGDPAAAYLMAAWPALDRDPAAWDALAADPDRYVGPPPAPADRAGVPWPYLAGGALAVVIVIFRPRGGP